MTADEERDEQLHDEPYKDTDDTNEDEAPREIRVKRNMMAIPLDDDFPDIFADAVNLHLGVYGISLVLGRTKGNLPDVKSVPVAVVRMSPELAFVLTQLLRKNLRRFQETIGPINVPDELLTSLEIEREL